MHTHASEGYRTGKEPEIPGLFSIPAILAGFLGVRLLDRAHADADEVCTQLLVKGLLFLLFMFVNSLLFHYLMYPSGLTTFVQIISAFSCYDFK